MIDKDSCGPLDVGDVRALIATHELSPADVAVALHEGQGSHEFDGPRDPLVGVSVVRGAATVAKAQHRAHERYATVTGFEALRRTTGLPAPRLLDSGTVTRSDGEVWWAVLQRVSAEEVTAPTRDRQRAVGSSLRAWHENAPVHGLRLDDDGGLGVFLGTPRAYLDADGYLALGAALSEACAGLPVAPIHGDLAVCHNALFRGDDLAAIIDPGAVHVGPPVLDLAWCLAIDLARGAADSTPLLEGYGTDSVDTDALEALLPLAQLRFLVDLAVAEASAEFAQLADLLSRRAPGLVESTGVLRPVDPARRRADP